MNMKHRLVTIMITATIQLNAAAAGSGVITAGSSQLGGYQHFIPLDDSGAPIDTSNGKLSFPSACVQDQTTGLTWEAKTADAGFRDNNWTYSWYNTDTETNGGNPGRSTSATCGGTLPKRQCNTKAYIDAVNAAGLCGANDWRLPALHELGTIVQANQTPAIDTAYFPTLQPSSYWTTTVMSGSQAWSLDFNNATPSAALKADGNAVILVRGESIAVPSSLSVASGSPDAATRATISKITAAAIPLIAGAWRVGNTGTFFVSNTKIITGLKFTAATGNVSGSCFTTQTVGPFPAIQVNGVLFSKTYTFSFRPAYNSFESITVKLNGSFASRLLGSMTYTASVALVTPFGSCRSSGRGTVSLHR